MLIAAYFELILPLFLIGGSFLFRKDMIHVACLNLPAVLSIIAGSLFLPLDSKSKFLSVSLKQWLFKWSPQPQTILT